MDIQNTMLRTSVAVYCKQVGLQL